MTKLFITGATGYIGGDALYAIAEAHPEYEITALVRNSDKGAQVAKVFPKVRLVYGDLDSSDLIAEESAKADIVGNFANCDHEGAARAIVKGLASRSSPGYVVHTSGTGILTVQDILASRYGVEGSEVYDDWDGIGTVTSLPDSAWHRTVDKIILGASKSSPNVKTAIVCPPTIYGPGRGPEYLCFFEEIYVVSFVRTMLDPSGYQQREARLWRTNKYLLGRAFIQRGYAFTIGEGKNIWTQIHVHDLSNLYVALIEEAATNGQRATWNDEGYYFAENGEFVWGDMCRKIARETKKQGYIESDELRTLTVEEGDEATPNGGKKWGYNSRCRAIRARKLLGWKPVGESIESLLPQLVKDEAQKLDVAKTHAQKAAGDA